MIIPYTDAFRVRTFCEPPNSLNMDSPKSLFRCGVVARASTFQISSHSYLQYIIRLIKPNLYYRLNTDYIKAKFFTLLQIICIKGCGGIMMRNVMYYRNVDGIPIFNVFQTIGCFLASYIRIDSLSLKFRRNALDCRGFFHLNKLSQSSSKDSQY